jgi:hypothetical protein
MNKCFSTKICTANTRAFVKDVSYTDFGVRMFEILSIVCMFCLYSGLLMSGDLCTKLVVLVHSANG